MFCYIRSGCYQLGNRYCNSKHGLYPNGMYHGSGSKRIVRDRRLPGSAYDIGRDALSAVLCDEDAKREKSILANALCERLSVNTVWDAVGKIYAEGRPFIASLASSVFDAEKKGDKGAEKIIDDCAKRLAELLELGRNSHGAFPRAVAGGGIFEHYGSVIIPYIKKYTDVEIVVPPFSQIYGACRAARKMEDGKIPTEFEENFKKSYKKS